MTCSIYQPDNIRKLDRSLPFNEGRSIGAAAAPTASLLPPGPSSALSLTPVPSLPAASASTGLVFPHKMLKDVPIMTKEGPPAVLKLGQLVCLSPSPRFGSTRS